jgi:hypothetical protein
MSTTNPVSFFLGLDLGKVNDYTALAVLERSTTAAGVSQYDVRALQRSALGTPYPKVVDAVKALVARAELRPPRPAPPPPALSPSPLPRGDVLVPPGPNPVLVVDATGVGVAIVDLFLKAGLAATIAPLTITSGGQARRDVWPSTRQAAYFVPKIELVGTTQMLLQTGRLRIAPALELAEVLKRELFAFEVTITQSSHESFGAWREGAHDDLVLAVAMAAWRGEAQTPSPGPAIVGGRRQFGQLVIR